MAGAARAALAAALAAAALAAAAPAHGAVVEAALEEESYQNRDPMRFVGSTTHGNVSVSVVIRDAGGKFVAVSSDPLLGADGAFAINTRLVEDVFERAGRYNATVFEDPPGESSGLVVRLEYDGSRVFEVPDYSVELRPVGDREAAEGKELSFTVRVEDGSLDGVEYSLGGGTPPGASIGESSGRFSWTPSAAQGHARGLDYTFDIVASKGLLQDSVPVRIKVFEPETAAPAPAPVAEPEDAAPPPAAPDPAPVPAPFVDASADPQSYVDRYLSEPSYREWFGRNYPGYDSIYQAVGLEEPVPLAPFVDPEADPQSYVDRYLSEPGYSEWFGRNYPGYDSIYQAVGLEEPVPLAPFVDPSADPQSYVDRYLAEPSYREWFGRNYPEYASIYEAVGLEEPAAEEPEFGECGEGTELVGSKCVVSRAEGGGCLIATAAYGTELAPQVQGLREVRDGTLLRTAPGAAFMAWLDPVYYSFSPAVADLERGSPEARAAVRALAAPMLHTLPLMGLADPGSGASVAALGMLVLALNAGIYVAAPSAAAAAAARAAAARRRGARRAARRA